MALSSPQRAALEKVKSHVEDVYHQGRDAAAAHIHRDHHREISGYGMGWELKEQHRSLHGLFGDVGDVVELSDGAHVRIASVEADIKNGRPGGDGEQIKGPTRYPEDAGRGRWFYADEVVRIVSEGRHRTRRFRLLRPRSRVNRRVGR